MATINQIGTGRKTIGTVDGIVYVTRKGVTYARATPIMPVAAYKTPAALKRQAIFKMVQMHMKYHLRTIKQTFTPQGGRLAYQPLLRAQRQALHQGPRHAGRALRGGRDGDPDRHRAGHQRLRHREPRGHRDRPPERLRRCVPDGRVALDHHPARQRRRQHRGGDRGRERHQHHV